MSSESIPPSKPKSAPEAPTEIFDWIKRADSKLPPNPEMTYSKPTFTVNHQLNRNEPTILTYNNGKKVCCEQLVFHILRVLN